jgi:enediyne biosynthesis protein E4
MAKARLLFWVSSAAVLFGLLSLHLLHGQQKVSPIRFELKLLPFHLDSNESLTARNVPETMAGGVAVFDCNGDGGLSNFLANGAESRPGDNLMTIASPG